MKYSNLLTALGVATMNATAGTPEPVYSPPPPEPSLCTWFIGGTYGQLDGVNTSLGNDFAGFIDDFEGFDVDDIDLDMYTLHFGRSFANTNGWDFAAYLEVAYLHGDTDLNATLFDGEDFVSASATFDLDIIPVTINFKVERELFGPISAYLTGGVGYAWTKLDAENIDKVDDGGFYAQASAGLIWNINESFELYGGARWLHLEDLEFGDDFELGLDDSLAWEVGLRYNF